MSNSRVKKIGTSVLGWSVAILGVPSAIGFFIDKLQKNITALALVQANDGVPLVRGSYLLSYFPLFFTALLISVGVIVLIWMLVANHDQRTRAAELANEAARSGLEAEREKRLAEEAGAAAARDRLAASKADFEMQSGYDQMCRSIQKVVFKGYNPVDPTQEPPPQVHFKSIECTFDISADGRAKVTQLYEVEAGAEGARFWTLRLDGDQYAEAFKTLQSIAFEATASDNMEVEAVPIDNEGYNRSVAIFFLPEIMPKKQRQFKINFDWRGWFGELATEGVTSWFWSYRTMEPSQPARVIFRFRFANELGAISCELLRQPLAGETLSKTHEGHQQVWTYEHLSHPAKRLDWALRFRKSAD